MPHLSDLLARQEIALERIRDRDLRSILGVYDAARRELREDLEGVMSRQGALSLPFTTRQRIETLRLLEHAVVTLRGRLERILRAKTREHADRGGRHSLAQVRAGPTGVLASGIKVVTVAQLDDLHETLLYRYSLRRYSAGLIERVVREVQIGTARGMTRREVVGRLAGPHGVMAGQRARAALIVRSELARAHDEGSKRTIEGLAEQERTAAGSSDLGYRAMEARDRRNHPFSRALDGTWAAAGEPWRVAVSEAQKVATAMKKGLGGVHWRINKGVYEGTQYPAHFGDRGRRVAWRKSWTS